MDYDLKTKKLKCSVREFAYGPPSQQSYRRSAIPFYLRTQEGINLHQVYQDRIKKLSSQQDTDVMIEYSIKYTQNVQKWKISLAGRIDCLIETADTITIEEIKSVNSLNSFDLNSDVGHFYCNQLRLYQQFYLGNPDRISGKKIILHLVLIELQTEAIKILEISTKNLTPFFKESLRLFIDYWEQLEILKHTRKEQASTIQFPFDQYRPNQQNIIKKTWDCLTQRKSILVAAPTGLGKTAGTLVPALKYSLENNMRLFAVTSKTTQQHVYQATLQDMEKGGSKFHAIILTAKEKMCINEQYLCDPNFCGFLENYEETDIESVVTKLLTHQIIDMKLLVKFAKKYKVCPFELALDCSLQCDLIIGDFNYVFNPQVRLRRYFEEKHDDIIVIVDEAHNLPNRARDYYSPEVTNEEIINLSMYLQNQPLSNALKTHGKRLLRELSQFLLSYAKLPQQDKPNPFVKHVFPVKLALTTFKRHTEKLEKFSLQYALKIKQITKIPPLPNDDFIAFIQKLHFFERILQERDKPEFSELFYPQERKLKIFCKSAAEKLRSQVKSMYCIIAQSATLFPLSYYRTMLGLAENTCAIEFPSPFPPEHHLYLTSAKISTRYADRPASIPEIARIIYEATECHIGNYLAFFPSFSYMHAVIDAIKPYQSTKKFLIQHPNMSEKERKQYLKKLRRPERNFILFGAHGGIFSEGVDYQGDMAIGLFIIGPGLPRYSYEQELMKTYFETKYQKGFEYAYRNPGMTRVIQAAGRIFRSKHDKGFVVFLGQRFATPYYARMFPADWNVESSTSIKKEIIHFWQTTLFPKAFQ